MSLSEIEVGIVYRINAIVDFIPEKNLIKCCRTGKEIPLFASASRCLLALVKAHGTVISQKELMYEGWEKNGLSVSINTFYQNISNIRRAFAEIDATLEVITTVKRCGLVFKRTHSLTVIEAANNIPQPNAVAPAMPARGKACMAREKRLFVFPLSLACLLLLSLLACFITNDTQPLFSNYHFYKNTSSGCAIYINNDATTTPEEEGMNNDLFNNSNFKRAYITLWNMHKRKSVVMCTGSYPESCDTRYYASYNS